MKILFTCVLFLVASQQLSAQGICISSPPAAPDSSAILDIRSTEKGLLIPRMTALQRTAIAAPAAGLIVYQVDAPAGIWMYDGSKWKCSSTGAADNLGNHIMMKNLATGNFYISKDGSSRGLAISDSGGISITTSAGNGVLEKRFRADAEGGFYAKGSLGIGAVPVSGEGSRMMWYPSKAAFRAGAVSATQWDEENTGLFSVATGYNCTASGPMAFAGGYGSTASGSKAISYGSSNISAGEAAFTIGLNCTASEQASFAIGSQCTAAGAMAFAGGYGCVAAGSKSLSFGSTDSAAGEAAFSTGANSSAAALASAAIGLMNRSYGQASITLGMLNTASGQAAAAIGTQCSSFGNYATAIGSQCTASGNYSIAMGSDANTNNFSGSIVLGDRSGSAFNNISSTANNQFTARYAGGYNFYTNPDATLGISLSPDGNSWSSISDSSKKEKYLPANGEIFLQKLKMMRLGSWNYKKQTAKNTRHYGPMAQEIFTAYGKDNYGTIGCDTTLASADMDGIMMILLQALEKRTEAQAAKLDEVMKENAELKKQVAAIEDIKKQLALLSYGK